MKLKPEMIRLNQQFDTKEEAIRAAGQLLVDGGYVNPSYVEAMLERETIVPTFMGNYVAIPHGTDEAKTEVLNTGMAILQIPEGVDFSQDGDEEQLAMMVFGLAGIEDEHLNLLSQIALFCAQTDNVAKLVDCQSVDEIISLLEGSDE